MEHRLWTSEEDQYIRDHYMAENTGIIAQKLNRTKSAVRHRREKLCMPPKKEMHPFTEDDRKEILIAISAGEPLADTAKRLGHHSSDVLKVARQMGFRSWKNPKMEKYIDSHGYEVHHFIGDKRVWTHRYVMEQFIGRPLTRSEVVHHINFNKLDNRIENLHLFPDIKSHSHAHNSLQKIFGRNDIIINNAVKNGLVEFSRTEGIYKLKPGVTV